MPGKSTNASPNYIDHMFDSHSVLAQFEPSLGPDAEPFVDHTDPVEAQEQAEVTIQHGTIGSPQVPVNELGIYQAPTYTEGCLSPLEAFNETPEPLATRVPEEPLFREPSGHIRSPILSKQPSRLEGLSRTVRNYVPTSISIAIPSTSPSPPRVSLPISFGRFMSPVQPSAPSDGATEADRRRSWESEAGVKALDEALRLDQHQLSQHNSRRLDLPRYPGSDDSEYITWARWDALNSMGAGPAMRVLILGYFSGLQIWDCTNLDSITELLNVSSTEWGRVLHAEILPSPPAAADDEFLNSRPVLGMIAKRPHQESDFLVYSLSAHKVVKKLSIPGIVSFSANPSVIVISTFSPTSLRIISSCTLASLSIVSSGLSTFTQPQSSLSSTPTTNPDTTVLPSTDNVTNNISAWPHPVFALSHRFLAYASRTPPVPGQQQAKTPVRAEGIGVHPDLGGMALRVGGTVLSGMRALGGRAITAARARISDTASAVPSRPLSRSAPEQGTLPKESDSRQAPTGCHVTVLDLAPLIAPSPRVPELIVEFLASKRQIISALQFSADGSALMVVPGDGQTIKVFQLRPVPRTLRFVINEAEQLEEGQNAHMPPESAPWHMYDLRRGRTSAIVEDLDWATDGRWVAAATQKRTVHIFATNPYGGQPDGHSHVNGRVYNSSKSSLSTSLPPLIRLRSGQLPASRPSAPLAFIFVHSNAHSLPKRLLPPSVVSLPSSTPSSTHSSPSREPLSPSHRRRRADFQDILIFDPANGSLSLRRCVISLRPIEQTLSVPSSVPGIGGTSISLPSRPSLGRVSIPLPAPTVAPRAGSGAALGQDKPTELVGHENEVATWNLKRGRGWPVVKGSVRPEGHVLETLSSTSAPNWLSFAELRTCSQSPQVLPRSLYLSHQFSFHALGDDYHGRLRRFQLDALGPRIEVRKEVEVSAYGAAAGEAFVHDSHDAGGTSSSFDEPLSSAMASGLEYPSSPPVIPMFPNGTPGSFKNSIPIQRVTAGLSDGMTEGFARVRREIGKVRSPRFDPHHNVTAGVPLEFEEEEEDFVLSYGGDGGTSPSHDDGGSVSASTPSSGVVDAGERRGHDGTWPGWEVGVPHGQDMGEQSQEISVVGFMDEEHGLTKRRSRSSVR